MKKSILLGLLAITTTFIAFFFHWYSFTTFGPGVDTDALIAGATISQLLIVVVSGSLTHVLVPLLALEDERSQRQIVWSFIFIIGFIFTIFSLALCTTASFWIPYIFPGFDNSAKLLAIEVTQIQMIAMIFAAINGVQWSFYQAREEFIRSEIIPIVSSVIALPLLFLAIPKFGIVAVALITMFRYILNTLLYGYGMGRPFIPQIKSNSINKICIQIKPLLFGTIYYKTDTLIDRFLLSTASSGSVSLFFLAQQLYGACSNILDKAIAAPLIPLLSKLYKENNKLIFKKKYLHKLIQIIIIGIIGLLIFIFCGKDFLYFLVGYGKMTSANISELWWLMILLGGMFIGGIAGQISTGAFYASGDTKTPTRIGILTFTLHVPLKVILFFYYGIQGLAIITSALVLMNLFLQIRFLKDIKFNNNSI